MKNLSDLKPGDTAYRYVSTIPTPMVLKVSNIEEKVIVCGPWAFDRETGGEIDLDFNWDDRTMTGSILYAEEKQHG